MYSSIEETSGECFIVGGTGQRGQAEVHPCNLKQRFCEFRLSRASLESIKVRKDLETDHLERPLFQCI